MDTRNFLDMSVRTQNEFVKTLLDTPQAIRHVILNRQVALAPENINEILKFIGLFPDFLKHTNFEALLNDIEILKLSSFLLTLNYSELTSSQKKCFLFRLATMPENQSREALRYQCDTYHNLNEIFTNLISTEIKSKIESLPFYDNILEILLDFIGSKTPLYPNMKISPGEFRKLQNRIFMDPISLDTNITTPVITPQGTTYENASIQRAIVEATNKAELNPTLKDMEDPITREPLKFHDLKPNHLFSAIKTLFENDFNYEVLLRLLKCPLSKVKRFFIDPVVAADGETYEYKNLRKYLLAHKNFTPKGVRQKGRFYPNLFATELIVGLGLLEEIQIQCVKPLNFYLSKRQNEPAYAGCIFGYHKDEKIKAAKTLRSLVLNETEDPTFFSKTRLINVLTQGRLREDSVDAIKYLREKYAKKEEEEKQALTSTDQTSNTLGITQAIMYRSLK